MLVVAFLILVIFVAGIITGWAINDMYSEKKAKEANVPVVAYPSTWFTTVTPQVSDNVSYQSSTGNADFTIDYTKPPIDED